MSSSRVSIGVISVWVSGGDEAPALAGHRLCLWIYIGAHAVALLFAMLLPREIRALHEPTGGRPETP